MIVEGDLKVYLAHKHKEGTVSGVTFCVPTLPDKNDPGRRVYTGRVEGIEQFLKFNGQPLHYPEKIAPETPVFRRIGKKKGWDLGCGEVLYIEGRHRAFRAGLIIQVFSLKNFVSA